MSVRDFGVLVLLAAVWGASFIFMRVATPEFGPWSLIALRMSLAALVLMPFLASREARETVRRHWRPLCVSGLLTSGLPFVLLAYATLTLNAGFTSLMNGSVPVFSALIARIWLGEPLGRSRIFGLLLGMAGLVVLIGDKLDFSLGGSGVPVLAAVLACVLYGYGASFIKRYLSALPPRQASVGSLIGASSLLVPLGIWQMPAENPSAMAWGAAILLATVCTGLAFVFFFGLLQRFGPTSATAVAFLIPIFGVFWGSLLLGEPITLRMGLGMGLSLSGTAFVTGLARPWLRRLQGRSN